MSGPAADGLSGDRGPDPRQPEARQPDPRQPEARQPDPRQYEARQPDPRQYEARQYEPPPSAGKLLLWILLFVTAALAVVLGGVYFT